MNDQDQLERDVEAALARLATNAVPDTERPPAPPWQERRRAVDARRFGRATPWLIAAVLLVIAGLGIGAATTFDAKGPERGPVGSHGPSPTGIATDGNGTLGDPTGTPTPRSAPSFDRSSNGAAPGDGLGEFVVGVGSYGPVRVGMTEAEALSAVGLTDTTFTNGPEVCRSAEIPQVDQPLTAAVMVSRDGLIMGIRPNAQATDADGNGRGATLAQLRATYPSGSVTESSGGWTFSVLDGELGIGFAFGSTEPTDSDMVTALYTGNTFFARAGETCVA